VKRKLVSKSLILNTSGFTSACGGKAQVAVLPALKLLEDFRCFQAAMRGRLVGVPCEVAEAEFSLTFCSYPKGGTFTTKLDLKS
jgi:hypothetical protein